MAINPFTMNSLYNQGIIDYVPYDLSNGMTSPVNPAMNPYMASAMGGTLYQQHGFVPDSFTSGIVGDSHIGTHSNAFRNSLGFDKEIGTYSSAGTNAFGLEGIGGNSTTGWSALGLNKPETPRFDRLNPIVKGLISTAVILGTFRMIFRGGKKPPVNVEPKPASKWNPKNWFHKK